MSVITIRAAVKAKVDELGSLHGSFDYETGKPTGFPFGTVTPDSGSTEFGDSAGSGSARNIQTSNFKVRIYQERESDLFGPEKAERVSLGVLDELLTAFQMDTTLSGTVLWQRPTEWNAGYDIRDKIVRLLEVTIQAVEDVNSK